MRSYFKCFLTAFLASVFLSFPGPSKASRCTASYKQAADKYYSYKKAGVLGTERCRELMELFRQVADSNPDCHKADDALYMVGMLGTLAYKSSGEERDLNQALRAYNSLFENHPDSTLADDARYYAGELYAASGDLEEAEKTFRAVAGMRGDMGEKAEKRLFELTELKAGREEGPASEGLGRADPGREQDKGSFTQTGPVVVPPAKEVKKRVEDINSADLAAKRYGLADDREARSDLSDPLAGVAAGGVERAPVIKAPEAKPGELARLMEVRYWSSRDYTRVVVELDREVPYAPAHLLRPDPELKTPPRLYVDFKNTSISQDMRDAGTPEAGCFTLPIGDGLLKKARAGQYRPEVARVVLDIERIDRYHAFALPGRPFRYVIDVYGEPSPLAGSGRDEGAGPRRKRKESSVRPSSSPRKYLVVIDAGHGGKDPGAVGLSGTREKDVTLALARRTKRLIESRGDIKVILTRSDDRYLGLVDRTAMANTLKADIFISIHCNASPDSRARGIETYYLDNTTDRAALKLAAKENFVTEQELSDSRDTTNLILADLITSSKVEDSVPLARYVQESVVGSVARRWDCPDKGVKKAPFWVLTGATMPCVLVEVSFISNRTEERRLRSSEYQHAVAQGISAGVVKYFESYDRLTMAE